MLWWLLGALAVGGGALLLASEEEEGDGRGAAKAASARVLRTMRGKAELAPVQIGPRFRRITDPPNAEELAALTREAIYIGPLDEDAVRWKLNELAATGGPDARYQIMNIARDAVTMGLDGNPKKVPPDPDGNVVAVWNDKQILLLQAIVDWWSSPLFAPKAHNIRLMNRDLLQWAYEMIVHPKADEGYQGRSIDSIYARNKSPGTLVRSHQYEIRFRNAIKRWASDVNVLYRDVPADRWRYEVITWGDLDDQAALVPALARELAWVGRDKMIIWPGGPPSDPQDDAATVAAMVVAAIVIAAATGVGV